jgi:hypothetical protein
MAQTDLICSPVATAQPKDKIPALFDNTIYASPGCERAVLRARVERYSILSGEMNFPSLSTPLRLRLTLRRLFKISKHPYFDFLRLLWPLLWYFSYPLPLPSPQELNNNNELFFRRQDGIQIQRIIPLWRLRDTPQQSLYRLYKAFCTNAGSAISRTYLRVRLV